MSISFGRVETLVAEHCADVANVNVVTEHISGERMAKRVRMNGLEAGISTNGAEDLTNGTIRDTLAGALRYE